MLSEKIASVRKPLEKFLNTGLEMTPKAVTSICVILRSLEVEAKGLERAVGVSAVDPDTAIGVSMPDNVVHLFKAAGRPGAAS